MQHLIRYRQQATPESATIYEIRMKSAALRNLSAHPASALLLNIVTARRLVHSAAHSTLFCYSYRYNNHIITFTFDSFYSI